MFLFATNGLSSESAMRCVGECDRGLPTNLLVCQQGIWRRTAYPPASDKLGHANTAKQQLQEPVLAGDCAAANESRRSSGSNRRLRYSRSDVHSSLHDALPILTAMPSGPP